MPVYWEKERKETILFYLFYKFFITMGAKQAKFDNPNANVINNVEFIDHISQLEFIQNFCDHLNNLKRNSFFNDSTPVTQKAAKKEIFKASNFSK